MWFHGIIEVNETGKLNAPVSAVFKASFAVPHIHQSADDSLGLAVGLRAINAGKLLPDTVLPASFNVRDFGQALETVLQCFKRCTVFS